MTTFESDYNNGAHPAVLQRLLATNTLPSASYGYDQWSEQARSSIRAACDCPAADIFFLVGGTQANATVIDVLLPSYGAVIATETGHINVHESGAVEACGHKVIALPSHEGRMLASDLKAYLERFYADPTWEHMAVPGMVYITFPTELGTLYTAAELQTIHEVCRRYELPLFIDGARLGYGLAASAGDVTLPFLATHCEAFYIGGTKVGALCGEAVVFPNGAPKGFFTMVKRHGALLAKSRLAGVQFDALFTDGLYLTIAQHAITMAMRLRQIFIDAGFEVKDSPTNQQFVVLSNEQKDQLMQQVLFETWEPIDTDRTLCRFVTSWATTDADLDHLATAIGHLE
ncbi:MAG: aminotransferase class I/II-fold pyridoxal phosphate-dependent enzyme [Prevotella sp.]|nr:aminotransferase class I/II-fold pyridoxal phosphate-dependent enzyme [Prevotella sp.]